MKNVEEYLKALRKNDREINRLMEEREQLKKEALAQGGWAFYNEIYEKLMDDGKEHWSF